MSTAREESSAESTAEPVRMIVSLIVRVWIAAVGTAARRICDSSPMSRPMLMSNDAISLPCLSRANIEVCPAPAPMTIDLARGADDRHSPPPGLATKISAASSGRSIIVDLPTPMLMRRAPIDSIPDVHRGQPRTGLKPGVDAESATSTGEHQCPPRPRGRWRSSGMQCAQRFEIVMTGSLVGRAEKVISAPAIGWCCRSG